MMRMCIFLIFALFLINSSIAQEGRPLGAFENNTDVGDVGREGFARYDPQSQVYFIGGSGANMWGRADAFQYLWKIMEGDFMLTANLRFLGAGGDPHRKAGWVIRKSLDPDAPYADAIVHGDGLTSLQYRMSEGAETQELNKPAINAADVIRLEKMGNQYTMYAARKGQPFQQVGELRLELGDQVYVGLGVCAHQQGALEMVEFSNVRIDRPVTEERQIMSRLEILDVYTGQREVFYKDKVHFEAPNWSRDGKYLIYNQEGRLYKISFDDKKPVMIETGFADRCNNDHGFSPDGDQIAISHNTSEEGSIIYTVPTDGGAPRRITSQGPSYWHGWSPDGSTLAYCARRNDEYDIYTIPVAGGTETRLTNADGLDDGPDYSPNGNFIYFNSVRTGKMQVWRMNKDGSGERQLTTDQYNDWFPHPSPDGKWLVFVSYHPEVEGHPANKKVMLRMMPAEGGEPQVLAYLYGGQGTINVPSWSPDGRKVAFVSYTYPD